MNAPSDQSAPTALTVLTGWISLCCGGPVIQFGGDGTPRWCGCRACGMPCVPVERNAASDEEQRR